MQRKSKPLHAPEVHVHPFSPSKVALHVQQVVRTTAVPTWFQSVPSTVGDAAAGTLKAAEWRSLATLYLPLALVSIWGDGTSHSSQEVAQTLRKLLDHTMILCIATQLTCSRTMTPNHNQLIRRCLSTYVEQLKTLYPRFAPRPNHHMAQHIPDFLDDFGPVHSWWCFPFENLIGVLQRLPHNHKSGEYFPTIDRIGR
jgi:hypothetical protein